MDSGSPCIRLCGGDFGVHALSSSSLVSPFWRLSLFTKPTPGHFTSPSSRGWELVEEYQIHPLDVWAWVAPQLGRGEPKTVKSVYKLVTVRELSRPESAKVEYAGILWREWAGTQKEGGASTQCWKDVARALETGGRLKDAQA